MSVISRKSPSAAASIEAGGTEVIVPDVVSEFESSLSKAILKVFTDLGFRNRGVKRESATPRKRLGWMRPNAENILLETCFISNPSDMKLYQDNKSLIAKQLANVLNQFSKL